MKKLKLTAAALVFMILAANAQSKNFLDVPYLDVTGSADSLVTPNEIFIRINISEKDTRDRVPVEELEKQMLDRLQQLGINVEKDLTARDMGSNFKSYFLRGRDVIKTRQYMLKVRNADMAGKVFIELEKLDISNTSLDHVGHSELEHIRNLIRTKAVENARARAVALTRSLNQSVGPAIHITDNEVLSPRSIGYSNQLQEVVVVRGISSLNKSEETPKIEFEKIKVASHINVKFKLNP